MASRTQQNARSSTTPSHAHSINPVGPDGIVRCWHDEPLDLLTSKSKANPGRQFYTCYKGKDDPEKCKFFKWADELAGSPAASQGKTVREPVTPSSPSKRAREVEATPSTPNVSPSKAAANAALHRSSKYNPGDDDDDVEVLPSDEEISQFLKGTAQSDRPAKKFKFHKTEEPGGTKTSLFSDMPNSALRSHTSADPSSASPTKTPNEKRNQWQAIQDDPENPFHARAAAISQAQTPGASVSRTSANNPVTPDSITQALDTFNGVPDLVKRLERKLLAAEKSRDARANQILKLQKEIQNLENRNSALEEEVEALKARFT